MYAYSGGYTLPASTAGSTWTTSGVNSASASYAGQAAYGAYPAQQYSIAAPSVAAPLTPKITASAGPTIADLYPGQMPMAKNSVPMVAVEPPGAYSNSTYVRAGTREQALEQRVRELESLLNLKEKTIQDLQAALASAKSGGGKSMGNSHKSRSPGRTGSGFRKVSESKPVIRYTATDQDDPIDVRLEEFYNNTGSAIQFRRINRGFYRFGDSIVELDIINHKLMARTEDGWNRGKFGPIEKFLMYYENIEREKAGILPES